MGDLVIWKFPVAVTDSFSLSMPRGAQILSVQTQRGLPQMWALVDPQVPPEQGHFRTMGTGHNYPAELFEFCRYLGTFQIDRGYLVWHIFEEGMSEEDEPL